MSEKKSKSTDQSNNQSAEPRGNHDVVKGMGVPKTPYSGSSTVTEGAAPPKQPISPSSKTEKPQDKNNKD